MCENIALAREIILYFCMSTLFALIAYIYSYAKKHDIDFNSIFGLFEIYKRAFQFKDLKLSLSIILGIYGNSVLILISLALFHWGTSQGCVFILSRRWASI